MAIVVSGLVCLYEFGIKGRRIHLLMLAGVTALLVVMAAPVFGLYPKVWIARMESTVLGNIQYSVDMGSREARTELMEISFKEMLAHPVVGVGPGNFGSFSGTWRVAHNTYTELGAEAGFPALFLFLLIMAKSVVNLRRVEKSHVYKTDTEIQVFTGAMVASFAAYILGAFFADTQYELFPYFMVSYATALYNMACVLPKLKGAVPDQRSSTGGNLRQRLDYGESRKTEVAWTR
jgi:O-antigen ligase